VEQRSPAEVQDEDSLYCALIPVTSKTALLQRPAAGSAVAIVKKS
jgi:hypothetical protein